MRDDDLSGTRRGIQRFLRYAGLLKWPLGIGVLALLYYLNRDQVSQLDRDDIRWGYAAVGFLLCGGAILLTFLRWFLLVWALEFKFSIRDAIRLGFFGYACNYVSFGAVGGDVVKAIALAGKQESRRTVAVATIFLDRILGLLALLLVGALISLFQSAETRHPVFVTAAGVFWGGAIAGLICLLIALHPATPKSRWMNAMVRWKYVGPIIGDFQNGVLLYQSKSRVLWTAVAISVVGHFAMLSSFYFCALSLSPAEGVPDFAAHLLFMPAAEIAAMVPIVPGGIGALEGAIAYFYGKAGFAEGTGLLTGLAYRVISVLLAALGAAYFFLSSSGKAAAGLSEAEIAKPAAGESQPVAGGASRES